MLLVIRVRFCYQLDLPAVAPPPEAMTTIEAVEASRSLDHSPATFAKYLQDDSNNNAIKPAATIESMSRVLPYQRKALDRMLHPGDSPIETLGLRLRLVVQDVRGTHKRQMVLEIENTSRTALAYRIKTRPSKGTQPCHEKRNLAHNAMAIAPSSTELRSECTYRSGWGLEVQSVETIQLPELSYLYVSWLAPDRVGMDRRVSGGHRTVGASKACEIRLPANVEHGLESEEISWRDMIDFYARHRCRTYSFPYGYRAFARDAAMALPVGKSY